MSHVPAKLLSLLEAQPTVIRKSAHAKKPKVDASVLLLGNRVNRQAGFDGLPGLASRAVAGRHGVDDLFVDEFVNRHAVTSERDDEPTLG